jgi:hypothetical protein
MEKFNDLKVLVDSLSIEVDSFYNKGNKASARRARKALQEIGKITKDFRKEISEKVNASKTQQV